MLWIGIFWMARYLLTAGTESERVHCQEQYKRGDRAQRRSQQLTPLSRSPYFPSCSYLPSFLPTNTIPFSQSTPG